MIKSNQQGAANGVVISLILTFVLLIGSMAFAAWAYSGRQDYKDNADAKVSAAVQTATRQESDKKDVQFAEAAKNPLKNYTGPAAYGSVSVSYPKTWSGYVDETGHGNALVDGYFAPGVVPSINGQNSVFALRVQVVSQPYSQILQSLAGQQQAGKISIKAYALPKFPNNPGIFLTGQVSNVSQNSTITMVVIPFRSQTIQLWTEGTQFVSDFNNYILPNFSFAP
jgi:hypothetical protein